LAVEIYSELGFWILGFERKFEQNELDDYENRIREKVWSALGKKEGLLENIYMWRDWPNEI